MEALFDELDYSHSVREFEYTRIARNGINRILRSTDLDMTDVGGIYEFLLSEMRIVSFKDHLKRYLYEATKPEEPFFCVPEREYLDILMDSFECNCAPFSFTPTSVRPKMAVKRWLTQENVQRKTVFLLGFGLRMSAEKVLEFLTKVLMESDFLVDDPQELCLWFCFFKGLPYSEYLQLLQFAEQVTVNAANDTCFISGEGLTEELKEHAEDSKDWEKILTSQDRLESVLYYLKKTGASVYRKEMIQECFRELYEQCLDTIFDIYASDETCRKSREQLGAADLERMLCDGIPKSDNGNQKKMSKSLLYHQFHQKRLTRQRLDKLLKGKLEIERFDLITLQFFLSSQSSEEDVLLRCQYFVNDVNYYLEKCGMYGLYPANPYEAFVTICMATEDALENYCDVWEKSYE